MEHYRTEIYDSSGFMLYFQDIKLQQSKPAIVRIA